MREHLLEEHKAVGQFHTEIVLLFTPLLKAMPPKFSFLVPAVGELFAARDELREVGVVQFERERLNVGVDVTPKKILHPVPLVREQSKLQAVVEIFADDL